MPVSAVVPMDSMSGTQILKFRGFTNRPGFGILTHGRAMRALGGADLDGDKVHIFFGDEEYGFKKDWKDMYHDQKNEFVNEDGSVDILDVVMMVNILVGGLP